MDLNYRVVGGDHHGQRVVTDSPVLRLPTRITAPVVRTPEEGPRTVADIQVQEYRLATTRSDLETIHVWVPLWLPEGAEQSFILRFCFLTPEEAAASTDRARLFAESRGLVRSLLVRHRTNVTDAKVQAQAAKISRAIEGDSAFTSIEALMINLHLLIQDIPDVANVADELVDAIAEMAKQRVRKVK